MKQEVLELYEEGFTISEIAEETGLAPSTVGVYIYSSKINKDPKAREAQLRAKVRKLVDEYENEFGTLPLSIINNKI